MVRCKTAADAPHIVEAVYSLSLSDPLERVTGARKSVKKREQAARPRRRSLETADGQPSIRAACDLFQSVWIKFLKLFSLRKFLKHRGPTRLHSPQAVDNTGIQF